MFTLPKEALCFKCVSSPEMIVYGDDRYAGKLYYSPDGVKFFEWKNKGFGGTSTKHNIHFEDPHHDRSGEFERNGGTLTWGRKTFKLGDCPFEIEVVPLPTVREAEYLFQLRGGVYLYVSHDKYNHQQYESFKLFLGRANHLTEIPIVGHVERYRDGGTTYIRTTKGVMYSPTPFNKEAKPTWDGVKMKALDPKNFVIEETGDTVTITKK